MTGRQQDYATLEVGDRLFSDWLEYVIDSDLMTPADGFTITGAVPGDAATRAEARSILKAGATCKLYVGRDVTNNPDTIQRALQMTGVIDDVEWGGDRSHGAMVNIKGRDLAAHL